MSVSSGMRYLTFAVCMGFVAAAGVYMLRITQAERPSPPAGVPTPQVEGRLGLITFTDTQEGIGYSGLCEFDALVTLENSTVVGIETVGTSVPIGLGETVKGVDSSDSPAPSGRVEGISVYRGGDGALYRGCAPESVFEKNTD